MAQSKSNPRIIRNPSTLPIRKPLAGAEAFIETPVHVRQRSATVKKGEGFFLWSRLRHRNCADRFYCRCPQESRGKNPASFPPPAGGPGERFSLPWPGRKAPASVIDYRFTTEFSVPVRTSPCPFLLCTHAGRTGHAKNRRQKRNAKEAEGKNRI